MKTKEITIENQEIVDLVESLQYEVESRKEIISFMIEKTLQNTENFESYQNEYREYFVQLSVAKNTLEQMIKAAYPEINILTWNLEFSTKKITVDYFDA